MNAPSAFGPYRVFHQTGSGVQGPVFRAFDLDQDHLVAIKVFTAPLTPDRVVQVADALRDLVRRLSPAPAGLVPVITAGIEGTEPFLVMACQAGDTLDVLLRRTRPFPLDTAVRVVSGVAEALGAAGRAGMRHGRLHPRDVFVSDGAVCVTGTGIADAFAHAHVHLPVPRFYAAPERRRAGAAWDGRSDVYALAVMAHEMLTGVRPAGPGEQDGVFPASTTPEQRVQLRRALARGLAERPEDRYPDAAALAADLQAAADGALIGENPSASSDDAGDHDTVAARATVAAGAAVAAVAAGDSVAAGDAVPAGAAGDVEPDADVTVVMAVAPVAESRPVAESQSALPSAAVTPPALRHPDPGAGLDLMRPARDVVPIAVHEQPRTRSTGAMAGLAAVGLFGMLLGGVVAYQVVAGANPAAGLTPGRITTEVPVPPAPEGSGAESAAAALPPDALPPGTPPAAAMPPVGPPASGEDGANAALVDAVPAHADRPTTAGADVARARLVVRSDPSGALVTVDGHLSGNTPTVVRNLLPGTHRVRVARPGHVPYETRVTIDETAAERTLSVSLAPGLDPGRSGPAVGTVDVDSRPRGAIVRVDGRTIGRAPLRVLALAPGAHEVALELGGYAPVTRRVEISAGAAASLNVTLKSLTP